MVVQTTVGVTDIVHEIDTTVIVDLSNASTVATMQRYWEQCPSPLESNVPRAVWLLQSRFLGRLCYFCLNNCFSSARNRNTILRAAMILQYNIWKTWRRKRRKKKHLQTLKSIEWCKWIFLQKLSQNAKTVRLEVSFQKHSLLRF